MNTGNLIDIFNSTTGAPSTEEVTFTQNDTVTSLGLLPEEIGNLPKISQLIRYTDDIVTYKELIAQQKKYLQQNNLAPLSDPVIPRLWIPAPVKTVGDINSLNISSLLKSDYTRLRHLDACLKKLQATWADVNLVKELWELEPVYIQERIELNNWLPVTKNEVNEVGEAGELSEVGKAGEVEEVPWPVKAENGNTLPGSFSNWHTQSTLEEEKPFYRAVLKRDNPEFNSLFKTQANKVLTRLWKDYHQLSKMPERHTRKRERLTTRLNYKLNRFTGESKQAIGNEFIAPGKLKRKVITIPVQRRTQIPVSEQCIPALSNNDNSVNSILQTTWKPCSLADRVGFIEGQVNCLTVRYLFNGEVWYGSTPSA